jgi:ABC-type uncharacterized transport system substrate-binding protein
MVTHPIGSTGPGTHPMRKSHFGLAVALAGTLLAAPAWAHPHVWVTMKSEIVYAPDGSVTGVRHAWTFDDMFSAFATQGLEQKVKGQFTREELAPLAEVNVTSLKEFDFFTYAKANGKKTPFNDPVDYWLDYTNSVLTLHFTLPFKTPVKARTLALDVYDPTYFVDFSFDQKDPVTLSGAPAQCKLNVVRPADATAQAQRLGEDFFTQMETNWGAQFANKVSVTCP